MNEDDVKRLVSEFVKGSLAIVSSGDLLNRMVEEQKKVQGESDLGRKLEIAERVAKGICKDLLRCEHPVVARQLNLQYIKGTGRGKLAYELVQEVENALLKKDLASYRELREARGELEKELDKYKERLVEYLTEKIWAGVKSKTARESGLSPLHAPGAVTRGEASNLYYGEEHGPSARLQAAKRFLNSICFGEDIAIYFDDDDLRSRINDLLTNTIGEKHIPKEKLAGLKVHIPSESDKPHLVFLKFLLWLYEKEGDEIIDKLRDIEIILYLVPPKEKGRTMPIPRLDPFFKRWLDRGERRGVLIKMRDHLYGFSRVAWGEGGKEVQDSIKLFANRYEILSSDLLRNGHVNYGVLRDMASMVIDVGKKVKWSPSLSFLRELT